FGGGITRPGHHGVALPSKWTSDPAPLNEAEQPSCRFWLLLDLAGSVGKGPSWAETPQESRTVNPGHRPGPRPRFGPRRTRESRGARRRCAHRAPARLAGYGLVSGTGRPVDPR